MLGKRGISLILLMSMTFTILGGIDVRALENEVLNDGIDFNIELEKIEEEEQKTTDENNEFTEDEKEEIGKDKENTEFDEGNRLLANFNDYDSLEIETPIIYNIAKKEIKDINIISDTTITVEKAKKWAKSKGATEEFISLADLFWKYSSSNGHVNPALAYAQSAKETGYGRFGGVLDASYHNTCGLKTSKGGADDDPNAHTRFGSWEEGVQAHLDHLALYASAEGYPRKNTYDPRHFSSIRGNAKTAYELGGKWAPSLTYGTAIAGLYAEMMSFVEDTDGHKEGWTKIDDKWYYLDNEGKKCTDWIEDDGEWYFLNHEGIMLTGWQMIKGSYYYLGNNGRMQKGIINDGYDDYLLDPVVGNLKYGWQIYNGEYYFGDKKTGVLKKGWYHDGYDWYYLNKDGKMQKGIINDGYDDYLLDPVVGNLKYGWQVYNGKYYFGDKKTGVLKKGWYHDGYDWYYMNLDSGVMQTGFLIENNEEYFLESSGVMAIGWKFIDGNWHYFKENGLMVKDVYIDGYYINSDGIYRNKKLIVIDAGHSKTGDRGSSSVYNGKRYYEGDINMQVASKLEKELIKKGYEVLMIRDENNIKNISLQERVNIANEKKADLFISIHHDSGTSSANGVTSFYSSYKPNIDNQDIVEAEGWGGIIKVDKTPSEQAKFSKKLSDRLIKNLANANNFKNRSSHDRNLYVTRETIMPAILVECGFLTNQSELKRIINPEIQDNTARIIADSIHDLYK